MTPSTVLVTGAGGFVGGALLRALSQDPLRRVVAVDRVAQPPDSVECNDWHVLDLGDADAIREVVVAERPSIAFHIAGLARGSDWEALYRANVSTTVALLEAVAETAPGCTVVIPGSAAEYGPVPADRLPIVEDEPLRPISPYGVSKAWQTLAALSFAARGLDVRAARLFNIIGPGLPESFALGAFARQLKDIAAGRCSPVVKTGYLDSSRDFLDVRDVAGGLVAVAERGSAGEVYNVCSGVGVSMRACLGTLIKATGLEVTIESEPARDSSSILDSTGSREKIGSGTGWTPLISLERSIEDLWASA